MYQDKDLSSEKQIQDKKAMREASRLRTGLPVEIDKRIKGILPMSPLEGPPLPKSIGIKWPWKKK